MDAPPAEAPITDRIAALVARLSLEEKVALTAGEDMWHVAGVDRLGIGALKMTDGPVGARGAGNSFGPPSACFPCGTALAATWDVDLVGRVGAELGDETRVKGAHVLLAPTVNMHRTPLAGRNFECFSEDPHLAARAAVAYVRGVQTQGVGACIKHFVANDSEHERFTMSSDVPERALREIYLRPFEAAVAEAAPVAVMAAYNRVHGTWCSEHPRLLTGILRDEWGFDGAVVSDWWGTHSTDAALLAGLDLEMPGPPVHRGPKLVAAVESGAVPEAAVDAAAARVLTLAARTGALDAGPGTEATADTPDRRRVAFEAAVGATVLLRNEAIRGRPVLPLDPAWVRSIAVVGPNADAHAILGGGSASVSPYYAVTVLDGITERFGGASIVHAPGPPVSRAPLLDIRWLSQPGDPDDHVLAVEYVAGTAAAGPPVATGTARRARLSWPVRPVSEVQPGEWSARLSAVLAVPATGVHTFELRGTGRFRLRIDGAVVVDAWNRDEPASRERCAGAVDLAAGPHGLLVEYAAPPAEAPFVALDIRCRAPVPDDALGAAVEAAAAADVAVVVVGHDQDWESEGRDRRSLALPAPQDELVARVAAANPATVVVLNTGAPVSMPWVDDVPAVVQAWFGGQEQGRAVAAVLAGDEDPGGRLPTTFPRRLEDTPAFINYPGEAGHLLYGEGIFVGYRWYDARGIEPLFCFGHGLSYTAFSYGDVSVRPDDDTWVIDTVVTNVGERAGSEVVQVYVEPPPGEWARPRRVLGGFTKVAAGAGQAVPVTVRLDARAFDVWDPDARGWRRPAGRYGVVVASSSRHERARASVDVA